MLVRTRFRNISDVSLGAYGPMPVRLNPVACGIFFRKCGAWVLTHPGTHPCVAFAHRRQSVAASCVHEQRVHLSIAACDRTIPILIPNEINMCGTRLFKTQASIIGGFFLFLGRHGCVALSLRSKT